MRPDQPYRTDLEALNRIQTDALQTPEQIFERHQEAFSIQRVAEQFFRDYS